MPTLQADYFASYRSLKLTRDASGVLIAEFHANGGPFTFTAQDHTELVDAFYRIAQDRANKIVILTGAAGEFIPGIDFSSFGNVADPGVWSQVHDEGVQIVENIANIRVPMIADIQVEGTFPDDQTRDRASSYSLEYDAAVRQGRTMIPGEYLLATDPIMANAGRRTEELDV